MDTILHFYTDLKRYSPSDIELMAKSVNLPNVDTRGKRWLLAVHYSRMKAELPSFLQEGPITLDTIIKYHEENPTDTELEEKLPEIVKLMTLPGYDELKTALTVKTDFMKKLLKQIIETNPSYQIKLLQQASITSDFDMLYNLYEYPISENATTVGLGVALGKKDYDLFRFLLQFKYKFSFIEKRVQELMNVEFYNIFYAKPRQGQVEQGKYTFKKELGKGKYGTVWLALDDENDREVAIKILVPKDPIDEMRITEEIDVLQAISNICQRYSTCILDHYWLNGRARIVMDYIKGEFVPSLRYENETEYIGTLYDYIKKISSQDRITNTSIMVHLIRGMDAFHKLDIANNDVKEANILWDGKDKIPRYTDWGFGCITKTHCKENGCSGVNCSGTIGTLYTAQPNAANTKESLIAGDMWSLGIVLLDFYLTPSGGDPVEDIHKRDFWYKYGNQLIANRPQGEIDMYVNRIQTPLGRDIVKLLLRVSRTERLANWSTVMDKIKDL